MSTYEISKSSLLSLKAEILRKQQELTKVKAENEVKIKIINRKAPLEIKNKGIEARSKFDETEEDANLLKQSRTALEYKAKLYEKLSSGELKEDEGHNRFLVRFNTKNKSQGNDLPPIKSEADIDKYPESEDEYYHSDEDINRDPGDKWVDYVDCFGRTRKCLQKDLDFLKSKDDELRKIVEEKKKKSENLTGSVNIESCTEQTENASDEAHENESTKVADESELLSSDMRRELLRQQWEKEEEELRNKSDIHYQDILFGEARTHGVGYYGFSKDEEERYKQQEALKKLRQETEQKQKKAQELKALREKQLAARIRAAKNRKRIRMGLPPEEDTPEPIAEPQISEEEKKRLEVLKQKEETEKILEMARKNHLRPWDIGKEGVKEHYEMTQEEWVNKKRNERPVEFAPPLSQRNEFRSVTTNFEVKDDTDKALKFTTKKDNRKRKHFKSESEVGKNMRYDSGNVDYEEIKQSALIPPTPIENLNVTPECEDRVLEDWIKQSAQSKDTSSDISTDSENEQRGKGAEIAPPPTFDYYGPSNMRIPKLASRSTNIDESIEAGLKFIRKKVEDKEKSTKHPREMYLY